MTKHQRIQLIFAALFGLCAVAFAAAGSHVFFERLNATGLLSAFDKGVNYTLYSALALLSVVILQSVFPNCRFALVGYLWILGTLLFAGGLFLHALAGLHQFIYVVPIGGTTLIAGWFLLAVLALMAKPQQGHV